MSDHWPRRKPITTSKGVSYAISTQNGPSYEAMVRKVATLKLAIAEAIAILEGDDE